MMAGGLVTQQRAYFYVSVLVGYILAYGLHFIDVARQINLFKRLGDGARLAKRRLLLLLFLAPLEPIRLLGFGWTSFGKRDMYKIPWIAPALFFACVGIANFSIYEATIDYMIAAYGPYSSSETGGNGFARELLIGVSTMCANPLYENIDQKKHHLNYQWASPILGCISILVVIPIYIFYLKGPYVRKKLKFAQVREADKKFERMSDEDYQDKGANYS